MGNLCLAVSDQRSSSSSIPIPTLCDTNIDVISSGNTLTFDINTSTFTSLIQISLHPNQGNNSIKIERNDANIIPTSYYNNLIVRQGNTFACVFAFSKDLSSYYVIVSNDDRITCVELTNELLLKPETTIPSQGCTITNEILADDTINILTYMFGSSRDDSDILNSSNMLTVQPSNLPMQGGCVDCPINIIRNDVFARNITTAIRGTILPLTQGSYYSIFNDTRTALAQLFINGNLSGSELPPPLPITPVPGQNFCTDPVIEFTNLQTSITTGDILEVDLNVMNSCVYDVVSKCYQSCSQIISGGTKFIIFGLFVNCTIEGPCSSNLIQKIPNEVVRRRVLIYAVLKMTLARLIFPAECEEENKSNKKKKSRSKKNKDNSECVKCNPCDSNNCDCNFEGDYDIKWLLRINYNLLHQAVQCSRYNQFIPTLDNNVNLEEFFRFDSFC